MISSSFNFLWERLFIGLTVNLYFVYVFLYDKMILILKLFN